MAITLRQESATGATTKGDSLTFSELDNNFIDILQNKIQAIQIDADSGSVNVGESLSNGVLTLSGGTNITTSVTEDSAGNANVVINGTDLNTTYTIGAAVDGPNANFTLTGSDASTDTIQFVAGSNITLNVDSAGAIEIAATDAVGITNIVEDTTPQLGGDLDVNGNSIVSASSGNITIAPNGSGNINLTPNTGSVIIDYATWPAEGTNGYVLSTNGAGTLSWVAQPSAGIANVVEDTTPQLGGNLDCQGNEIQNPVLEDYAETVYALGSTDSPTITVSNGNVQTVSITSGLSLPAFSDAATGQTVTLIVTGSGTASGTGAYKFAGGNTTLTSYSVVSIFYDGTTYWASVSTDYQ
jgi:hypothetical protein